MRLKMFEEFEREASMAKSVAANRFLSDLEKEYDLRKGKPFDKNKGNCAWFTVTFSEWAHERGIDHKIVYFPETASAPEAHIAPIIGNDVIDFAHKQFSKNSEELYKISKPQDYQKFGYDSWEILDELPPLETVFSLDKK
jgi:hypothetical protein